MQSGVELPAVAVLLGLLVALCVVAAVALYRSPYTVAQSVLYLADVLLTRVWWRTEVTGRFDLPADRGAVIVCNHSSPVEPFFIQLLPRRLVHWMIAAEYFSIPLLGTFLRYMQAIPARRGGIDTASTRQAIRYAAEGGLVGMLPEGRINETSQLLLPGRPGAVLVAVKARVCIIPCYVAGAPYDGTEWGCFFMRAKVRLIVGPPLDLSEYFDRELTPEVLADLTRRMMRAIARLAGREDFEPQVAGRRWKPELDGPPDP